jgi:hypothetical protein
MTGLLRQHARVEAQQRQGAVVSRFDRRVEDHGRVSADGEPAIAAEFVFELTRPASR